MSEPVWVPDTLVDGYQQLVLPLPMAAPAAGEPDDPSLITATLVRRNPPKHRRAMLYVHGWNDYFFQSHLADVVDQLGFDFHALDLRRFGRSLRPGQIPGFITDLDEYTQELDAALDELRRTHSSVTLMAHSMGGLVGSLWADQRRGELDGIILNSPWLDLQGSLLLRTVTAPVLQRLSGAIPTTALPLPNNGLYARTIDATLDGEWQMHPELKNTTSFQIRVGWISAIMAGHERVAQGLGIDTPVLALASARSDFRRSWDESLKRADAVLDVRRIAERAVRLGPHVTVVRIDGGLHDLALSAPEVRSVYFDEIARWVAAYLD